MRFLSACKNCTFWDYEGDELMSSNSVSMPMRRCMRYPPQVAVHPALIRYDDNGDPIGDPGESVVTVFPLTRAAETCGEFKSRHTKKGAK